MPAPRPTGIAYAKKVPERGRGETGKGPVGLNCFTPPLEPLAALL